MPNNVVYITKLQGTQHIKPMAIDEKTFQERKSFYFRDGWMVAPQSLIERYYELTPTKEKAEKPKAKKEEEKQP